MNAPGVSLDRTHEVGRHVVRQTTAYALLRSTSGIITWAAFVLLTRILDRRSFGAFEIGMFYVGVGQIIGDGGLAASLVRRRGRVLPIQYRTAQTAAFALAATLALALNACASFIGRANHLTPSEVWALRALAPLYLVPAFRVVPYAKLERRVDFAAIGRVELYANLARHTTAVLVALLEGGVWALVLSQLVLAVTQLVLAYRAAPGLAGFAFSRRAFRSLYGYGSKIQASVLLLHFKDNLSAGLLGPALGPTAVGVFRFALEFVRVPADIGSSLARVQFPVYTQHRQHSTELRDVIRGALRGSFIVGLPALGVFALLSEWVIPLVYGHKWAAALPLVIALVPHVAADLLIFHLVTFVQGRGRAGLALGVYAAWSLSLWLFSAGALEAAPGSLSAVALAHGAGSLLIVAGLLWWVSRYLEYSLWRALAAPFCAAALSFVATLALRSTWTTSNVVEAAGSALFFVALYLACLLSVEGRRVVSEVRSALQSFRP
ncbi:MAG TPA: oligosaccharide flippase family protein [Polyangiaceae bacterium]|nr:oligosaccharide flippase family protein [Polyangiaceae bacterium]